MKTIKIKSIKKIDNNSKRYDIQTKKTNNFFANGILVHNSIIKVYFYNDEWRIATNGTIDASNAISRDGINFKTLFFDILSKSNFDEMTKNFDKKNTYIFEMIHPLTQIVVNYENLKELVFIGVIQNECNENGKIVDYDIFSIYNKMRKIFKNNSVRFPRRFDLSDKTDLSDLSKIADEENISGNDFEGFVVTQIDDGKVIGRVKIKSPKYVQLHHVATGESVTNNLITVLIKNEMEEFEIYLKNLPPHVSEEYKSLKKRYFKLVRHLNKYGKIYREKSINITRKELAIDIKNTIPKYSGFIFTMIDNHNITPEKIMEKMGVKKIKSLLEK